MNQRVIRRASNQSRVAVANLLEGLFVAEMLEPSSRILLVSPWISDFPILDNRSGRFQHLDPRWGATRVRLSAILRSLLSRGTTIYLACRPGEREDSFVENVLAAAELDGTSDYLRLRRSTDLALHHHAHEKALVADRWALHGSMNFTYSGVELNGELVTFTYDPESVAVLASELSTVFEEIR